MASYQKGLTSVDFSNAYAVTDSVHEKRNYYTNIQ